MAQTQETRAAGQANKAERRLALVSPAVCALVFRNAAPVKRQKAIMMRMNSTAAIPIYGVWVSAVVLFRAWERHSP